MWLVGEKVYIRAIESEDNSMLLELINDPETEKMVGGTAWPTSKEEQVIWQKNQAGRRIYLEELWLIRILILQQEL